MPCRKTKSHQLTRSVFNGLRARAIIEYDQAACSFGVARYFFQIAFDFIMITRDRKKTLIVNKFPFSVSFVVNKCWKNDKNIFKMFFVFRLEKCQEVIRLTATRHSYDNHVERQPRPRRFDVLRGRAKRVGTRPRSLRREEEAPGRKCFEKWDFVRKVRFFEFAGFFLNFRLCWSFFPKNNG